MAYRLGVDLGTTFTAAAVLRDGSAPEVFTLGDRSAAVPSVLFIGADGAVLYGEAAERRALSDPDRVVRQFKRRIGDETPLVVGCARHQRHFAHDLAAMMIAWVVERVTEREGAAPEALAVTHPAAWGPHKMDLLRGALADQGLTEVTFVSEPEAAAISYANTGRLGATSTVGVYDLGGGTFDVALLRGTGDGRFEFLGRPHGLPDLGGIDFDDAILTHVLGSLGEKFDAELLEGDLDDATATAVARLRADSVTAKEALSADTAATVPVVFADLATNIRITRAEFEYLIGGAVEQTLDTFERAISDARVSADELTCVLLTGGSSRIPLVTQMLSAHLDSHVVVTRDIDPKLAVATGAALALALSDAAEDVSDVIEDVADLELDGEDHDGDTYDDADEDEATEDAPVRARLSVLRPARSPKAPKAPRPEKATKPDKAPRPEKAQKPEKARPIKAGKESRPSVPAEVAASVAAPVPAPPLTSGPASDSASPARPALPAAAKVALQKVPQRLSGTKPAREAAALQAAGLGSVPTPVLDGEPGTGRPILPRRGATRASVVGLEPEAGPRQVARAVVPALGAGEPATAAMPAQRMVVPSRPVAPLAALLHSEPLDRIASIPQPAAMEIGPELELVSVESAAVALAPQPPRPAIRDAIFVDEDYLVEEFEPEGTRGKWVLITVRRVLAVTTLTAALVAGSGAWVAASSPTIEPAAAATTHSAKHDK